jgi:hypothetical protein
VTWADEVHAHGDLRQISPRLWTVTGSLPRSPLPRHMIVWRLDDGGLLLHSVVAMDEPRMAQLEAIGAPRVMVVPNGRHRSHAAAYATRFPGLLVTCPAAARRRVEQVVQVAEVAEAVLPRFGVRVHVPAGLKPDELVYEVDAAPGRALLFTDMLFNLGHLPGVRGAVLRALGSTGGFGMTPIGRLVMLRDRAAFHAWLLELSRLPDLRMLLVAHGAPVMESAADRLREAAARL